MLSCAIVDGYIRNQNTTVSLKAMSNHNQKLHPLHRRVCPWLSRLRLTTEWSKLNENRPKPMETTFHDLTLLVFYI
ncbi:hypothetical protein GCK32_006257 [Trichostrongylus colubriformis]|uniref:Uncharacterized protein n=1 Tax=Trichostrongylus colubriformis TaxID=6319 RepID=A0AAN8IFD8_TRICO